MAESRRYSLTKFSVLTDTESIGSAKRKCLIWITIVTILFCTAVAYFSIKIFMSPTNSYQIPLLDDSHSSSVLKLYNPKTLLAEFKRTRDIAREESQSRLESIPSVLIEEIFKKNFDNIHDFIHLDLLVHYRNLISQNTRTNLKKLFNEYQSKLALVRNSQDFLHFLRSLNSNKFKFYYQALKGENFKLNNFQNVFTLTEELNHWYNYLEELNLFLSEYDQQKYKNYSVNCTELNFHAFTEDTQKHSLRFVYPFNITEKKVQEINKVIQEWEKPMKIQFGTDSVSFYGKVILLSNMNKILKQYNQLKFVYLFASHTIYLDDDIHLPGVNLAIMAPNWAFLKTVRINLNGLNGRNMTNNASPGQAGKPGSPGGNGGDFLGVGNPYEKYFLISANGGRGGNGQNGAKGQDGINRTRPDPPVDKPGCAIKVTAFKNTFGQTITHYKVYNRLGCGASGTDGGIGGRGGAGGVIKLISEKSVKTKIGLMGPTGSPGKGGPGGVGGRDGCFYEVFDVDDETLHRITRVKCPNGNVLPNGNFGRDGYNTRGQMLPPNKANLNVHKTLIQFLQLFSNDFNPVVLPLLKQLMRISEYNPGDIINEYKLLEELDKPVLYDLLYEQINQYNQKTTTHSVVEYIKSLTLARMVLLKPTVSFHFIDFKSYLNLLKKSIKNTNEHCKDFEPSLYLKQKVNIKMEMIQQNLKRMRVAFNRINPKGVEDLCELVDNMLQHLINETSEVKHLKFGSRLVDSSNKTSTRGSLTKTEIFFSNLENEQDVRGYLLRVKNALLPAEDSEVLTNEEKRLLQGISDEVERFLVLYHFTERETLENLFLESLKRLPEVEGVEFWKIRLINAMIALQYNLATDAARLKFQPSKKFELSQNKSIIDDVLNQITLLEENDNESHYLKAVFDRYSAVGGFYFWSNNEIRKALKSLFSGTEIQLKSNLINRHVFDKNFLQFTSLKLEFECDQNDCQKELMGILGGFKIEMTHSGFSYYNWKDETRIVVSEKVKLVYSFRERDNKEPEIYNTIYKKCQNGEIKLSPFTTWTVRLLPIDEDSDFDKLLPFTDKINLRLIGTGTYTS